jgi:[ribosomal protein S18]-alanine N-acetyltransferase
MWRRNFKSAALVTRLFRRAEPVLSEAGPRDAAAIAALHAKSFRRGWSEEEIERLLVDSQVLCHRALAGRLHVGFILSRRAADEAEILSIAVAPAWQGRGLAGRLLLLHLRRLAGLGIRAVYLEVDERNVPARRLYARAGFAEVGRRQGYYAQSGESGATALVLRRNIG